MIARAIALLIASVIAPAGARESVPQVKAKLEEPVLEELMGGCSLRCSFVWTVEVSPGGGQRGTRVKVLNDESAQTAWISSHTNGGVGARFRLVFPKKLPAEIEGNTPIYGIDLINGYWKTEELWEQHARVKKARVYYNDRPFRDVQFADSRRWQRLTFPDFYARSGDSMMIEVLEIYPGKSKPLAITELVLEGGH